MVSCLNGRTSGIGIVKHGRARRTKQLFGIAIEKSNIEGDLMQIELPDSANDFVRTQIRNRGERRFARCKSETGATCSAYNLNIHTILGGGRCSEKLLPVLPVLYVTKVGD